jgi:hypothetical protein
MTSSKGRRPSPAMIVAMTALIIALAGTAMAAPTAIKSILSKKEKKQTKNIANNQINTLAPGLSVKHADTAGTAGSADTAKRADVATTADALGGQSLANIVVAKSDTPGAQCDPNTATFIACATVNMTLPHEGRVLLIGTAGQISINNADSSGNCLFQVDGVNSGGVVLVGNAPAPGLTIVAARGFPNGFANTVVTDPVSAGPHSFALACDQSVADVEFEGPQITAALVGSG